jgi:ribosomal-protein-alanine N-acetyltransferase
MTAPASPTIAVNHVDTSFLPAVMKIMAASFDPAYGEAWTAAQCMDMLGGRHAWLLLGELDGRPAGFALTRAILDEAELLLIAVTPEARRHGLGLRLLNATADRARACGVRRLFLEVRSNNPAVELYTSAGFVKVGERPNYYRGSQGEQFDAHTYSLAL